MKDLNRNLIIVVIILLGFSVYMFNQLQTVKKAMYCRDIAIEYTIQSLYNNLEYEFLAMDSENFGWESYNDIYYDALGNCSKNYTYEDWLRTASFN